MNIVIHFRYQVRRMLSNDGTLNHQSFVDEACTCDITVADVPNDRPADGRVDYDVLWQAEEGLLAELAKSPQHHLLGWEALGSNQNVLSKFIVNLPLDSP